MGIALLLVAILGHLALWAGAVNRLHATGLSRSLVRGLSVVFFAAFLSIPVGLGVVLTRIGFRPLEPLPWSAIPKWAIAYLSLCGVLAVAVPVVWLWHRLIHRPEGILWSQRSRLVKISGGGASSLSEEHTHHFLSNLPGNQILQIDLAERALRVPRLQANLDGLSVVHLSDLHFTGRIGKAFFREVVALSNEVAPDLVALTGDLVDTEECIDWVPDVLGQLTARHGVYFVLGNHDRRVDTKRLRQTLVEAGLMDLGGRWVRREVNGETVVLAGNELPWFPPAADMRSAPSRDADGGPLRILLAHSPDQLDWAIAHDFDLMLAGHLHGGQLRLPLIGAILAPSRQGTRFAAGVFHSPPTILHVSRGLSGEWPIRWNCPPELARITLHTTRSEGAGAE
jgi:uncharacterized protein